jgi:methylated-DNA-[protein]-cysteine S-methyltransferase
MEVHSRMPSPVGELLLTAEDGALTGVWFAGSHQPSGPQDDQALQSARKQLQAYFVGSLRDFDLPLAPRGTPFQHRVWQEIGRIPYGSTVSYGELARRLGAPRAVRAAAGATGRNPLAIVIPCHRVIGADGSLTGYGGGLERKRLLLRLEGALED